MEIIYNDDKLIEKQWQIKMEEAIQLCVEGEQLDSDNIEVSISFVSNEEIQQLNAQYRDKDCVTDVLSFPQYDSIDEMNKSEVICLGDVVISLDKAEEQSIEYGHAFQRELVYLTVHSILHLLGYDHMTDEEKKIMRNKEEVIMKEIYLERLE